MSKSLPQTVVRKAESRDSENLLRLIRALADYEKLEPPSADAQQRLIRDAFGPNPRIQVLLAEVTGASAPVGYAILLETYSSFLALPTLFLEDIFILDDYRGVGAGYAMFREVVAEAKRRGCGRVEWMVLHWNQLARDFYARQGAEHLDEWCTYRLPMERFEQVLKD